MQETVTDVLGIEIPSTSPVFLTIVGVHVVFGIAAVAFGAVAIFSKKRRGRHSQFGTYYYWAVVWTVASAGVLTAMRFEDNLDVMALGLLCLAAVLLGRRALQQRGWVPLHIALMGSSYILLLTAFYVENGEDIPIWDRLPAIAYWLVPAAIGIPIILLAHRFHPLARRAAQD